MSLLTDQVRHAIADLAKARGLDRARVREKVNAQGELVIALIIPPKYPGEWSTR